MSEKNEKDLKTGSTVTITTTTTITASDPVATAAIVAAAAAAIGFATLKKNPTCCAECGIIIQGKNCNLQCQS